MEIQLHTHEFPPVYDENSRILILGSFPSVKSREQQFFYGHPRNRFWPLLAAIYQEIVPVTVEEKKAFLLRHRIALWDVIDSCEIAGSSDSSIRNAVPCDLRQIMDTAPIRKIYLNGGTAAKWYRKFWKNENWNDMQLPSTSPANAAWTFEKLFDSWKRILEQDEGNEFPVGEKHEI